VDAIKEDLRWLGIDWDGEVRVQSEHMAGYAAALARLQSLGVTYPCFCTRKEILAEVQRAGEAPQGPEGPVYPGTCRGLGPDDVSERLSSGTDFSVRVDVAKASAMAGSLTWSEAGVGELDVDPFAFGDFVVARKETPTSYHLSVVVDDADQGVTLVTRGEDLRSATQPQRLLQALFGLPPPRYRHHGLVLDETGKRMAKRDGSTTVRSLRESGLSPDAVLERAKRSVQENRGH
jgi:glutamyl-Q tRNA(Asp) synthetase